MSLQQLFIAFSEYLHSSHFLASARHTSFPNAFSRDRKLPLPALIALLLSGMHKNIQAELDEFFVHLEQQAQLARHVSERAFFSARAKLAATAIPALNTWLVEHADASGFVPRWHGLRLVAADASTLKFGHHASHVPRAASTEQIAFGLFLPGAEMMLAASLHSIHENERQMLFQHLDHAGTGHRRGDRTISHRADPPRQSRLCPYGAKTAVALTIATRRPSHRYACQRHAAHHTKNILP